MVWIVDAAERREAARVALEAFVAGLGLSEEAARAYASLMEEYTDAVYDDASASATYYDGYGGCPTCGGEG